MGKSPASRREERPFVNRCLTKYPPRFTGYNMAKNLRAKIPETDTLLIRDVNEESMSRFVKEAREVARSSGAGDDTSEVLVAQTARELAEKSVS